VTERLVVVSNRTPKPGKVAAGGLAAALDGVLKQLGGIWVGWSGDFAEQPGKPRHLDVGGNEIVHIDLNKADHAAYYAGYSNSVLWPTFHMRPELARFNTDFYEGYIRVNEQFADALLPLLRPDDLIWVHDYHLIPLGRLLRKRGVTNRIGFFLHIPFPTPEALSAIPSHRHLIGSLNAYDLVGLQAKRDVAALEDFASPVEFVRPAPQLRPARPGHRCQRQRLPHRFRSRGVRAHGRTAGDPQGHGHLQQVDRRSPVDPRRRPARLHQGPAAAHRSL